MVAPRRPSASTPTVSALPSPTRLLEVQAELFAAATDVEALQRLVVERALALTDAAGAALAEVEGNDVTCRAATGSVARAVGEKLQVEASLTGQAVRGLEVVRCDDSELDGRVDRVTCRRLGARSFVVATLRLGERLLGVLFVLSPRVGGFGAEHEELMRLFAPGAAAALALAEERRQKREREHERDALRETLREREAELDAVLGCLPDAAWVVGGLGPRANRAGLELLGVESAAQVPASPSALAERLQARAADTRAPLPEGEAPLAVALGGETAVRELLVRHARAEGEVQVLARAAPVVLEGRVRGAVEVLADVTLQRKVEEQRDQFMALVEQSSDAIGLLTLGGKPLYLNAAGRALVGYESLEAFRAAPLLDSYLPEDHEAARAAYLWVRERNEPWKGELRLCHRGTGEAIPVLLHVFALVHRETGRPVALASVARELTAEKRAEAVRERLLDIVGNDLRAPLSPIVVASSTLLRRGTLTEADTRAAARIAHSAERLGRMIDQVLDFTRTRLGAGLVLLRSRVDLDALAQDAVAEAELAHPDRLVRYVRRGETRGTWDRERLKELLVQLLDNALRHGDPERPVDVQVRGEGEEVVLEVRNQGEPIPPEVLPALFDPFRQVSTGDTRGEHLGLGLYIAREIALAHGGTIDVRSSATEGTAFHVRLPRGPATR